MRDNFFSIMFLVFFGLTSVLFFVIALVIRILTQAFDKRLVILHLFSSFWAFFYILCFPNWSVKVLGREKLDWKKNYIFVSNHQSQLDILLAYGLFFPFKWISKTEVFNLPFIGWNMWLNRYIRLKRGDSQSVKKMMEDCENALKQGCSVYFFPEGTRSSTGNLKPFKTGAFILAKKMNISILPVVINGTMKALPKNSLTLSDNHQLSVRVLDEIPCSAVAQMTPEEVAVMVRDRIARHVTVPQSIKKTALNAAS